MCLASASRRCWSIMQASEFEYQVGLDVVMNKEEDGRCEPLYAFDQHLGEVDGNRYIDEMSGHRAILDLVGASEAFIVPERTVQQPRTWRQASARPPAPDRISIFGSQLETEAFKPSCLGDRACSNGRDG